jgi:hypothetical protein
MATYTAPLGDFKSARSASKTGGSQSASRSYDYAGADLVQKRADELSNVNASRRSALHSGDIASALATGRRISDLSAYVNAYRESGGAGGMYGGVFGEVVPGMRVSSESQASSSDHSGSADMEYYPMQRPEAPEAPKFPPRGNKPDAPKRFEPPAPVRPPQNGIIRNVPPPQQPPMSTAPPPVAPYPPPPAGFQFNWPSILPLR